MSHEHKPQTLTKNNFSEKVLESPRPVLVDFWADWCAPCRAVAPVVDQVADQFEDQLAVAKVNVDEEPELAQIALRFGADDLDGTIIEERIIHGAGSETSQGLTRQRIEQLIRDAGCTPIERDTLYNPVEAG